MSKVKIVLHEECIAAGGRQEYPDGQTGSVIARHAREKLLRVKFGKPFIGRNRTGQKERKTDGQNSMWIPEWLTQSV